LEVSGGIPPMQAVQRIAIIGGRCTIWGDLTPALIWRAGHTIREWVEGEGDARVAWCEITRGDNKEVIRRKFPVEDAKRAGLWDARPKVKRKDNSNTWREEDNESLWYRYDERLPRMRARGFCARDGVPDALHGLCIRKEIEEERRPSDAQEKVVEMDAENVLAPPTPGEDLETPAPLAEPARSSAHRGKTPRWRRSMRSSPSFMQAMATPRSRLSGFCGSPDPDSGRNERS
jgi:hypothetical protein